MLYIVDDAVDYQFLVRQVFKSFLPQYPLRLFSNGLELIQYIEQHSEQLPDAPEHPQLIILDVDMPRLNGFQTLERLRAFTRWQSIPVVMMSNRTDEHFAQTAYALGARSFIAKPMDFDALKDVMRDLCQQWVNVSTH